MAIAAGRLWFWRVKPQMRLAYPALCVALEAGRKPAELETIPVSEILKALKNHYPTLSLSRKRSVGEIDLEDEEMAVELAWSERHFYFAFYGHATPHIQRVVDVMTGLMMPCYDASDGKMYTLTKPPRYLGTPEQEAIEAEVNKILNEEADKLRESILDPLLRAKRSLEFLKSGGMKRTYEEAARRIAARNSGNAAPMQ